MECARVFQIRAWCGLQRRIDIGCEEGRVVRIVTHQSLHLVEPPWICRVHVREGAHLGIKRKQCT